MQENSDNIISPMKADKSVNEFSFGLDIADAKAIEVNFIIL